MPWHQRLVFLKFLGAELFGEDGWPELGDDPASPLPEVANPTGWRPRLAIKAEQR